MQKLHPQELLEHLFLCKRYYKICSSLTFDESPFFHIDNATGSVFMRSVHTTAVTPIPGCSLDPEC